MTVDQVVICIWAGVAAVMALVVVMIGRGGIRVAAAAVVVCSLVEIATQIVVAL